MSYLPRWHILFPLRYKDCGRLRGVWWDASFLIGRSRATRGPV
jgi:hypothetical protein